MYQYGIAMIYVNIPPTSTFHDTYFIFSGYILCDISYMTYTLLVYHAFYDIY